MYLAFWIPFLVASHLDEFRTIAEEAEKQIRKFPSTMAQMREECTLGELSSIGSDADWAVLFTCVPKQYEVIEDKPSFAKQEFLGKGGQAEVFKVSEDGGRTYQVLKQFLDLSGEDVKSIINSLIMLKDISDHKLIIATQRLWLEGMEFGIGYKIWSTQPYIDGVNMDQLLDEYFSKAPKTDGMSVMPEAVIHAITYQLLEALKLLHENGVAHLDIKRENVMMNKKGQVFLIDYDMSRPFGTKLSTPIGTPFYLGPEQVNFREWTVTEHTDMWYFGMLIFELVTGDNPLGDIPQDFALLKLPSLHPLNHYGEIPAMFEGEECRKLREALLKAAADNDKSLEAHVMRLKACPVSYTIYACLQRDPKLRPSASELLPLFKSVIRPRSKSVDSIRSKAASSAARSKSDDMQNKAAVPLIKHAAEMVEAYRVLRRVEKMGIDENSKYLKFGKVSEVGDYNWQLPITEATSNTVKLLTYGALKLKCISKNHMITIDPTSGIAHIHWNYAKEEKNMEDWFKSLSPNYTVDVVLTMIKGILAALKELADKKLFLPDIDVLSFSTDGKGVWFIVHVETLTETPVPKTENFFFLDSPLLLKGKPYSHKDELWSLAMSILYLFNPDVANPDHLMSEWLKTANNEKGTLTDAEIDEMAKQMIDRISEELPEGDEWLIPILKGMFERCIGAEEIDYNQLIEMVDKAMSSNVSHSNAGQIEGSDEENEFSDSDEEGGDAVGFEVDDSLRDVANLSPEEFQAWMDNAGSSPSVASAPSDGGPSEPNAKLTSETHGSPDNILALEEMVKVLEEQDAKLEEQALQKKIEELEKANEEAKKELEKVLKAKSNDSANANTGGGALPPSQEERI